MHLTSAVATALLSSVAFAKPVQDRATPPSPVVPIKKTFTVKQVRPNKAVVPAGAVAILNTYKKFGKAAAAPKKVQSAAKAAQQTGSVIAVPQSYDMAYLSPVNVGGQMMNLNFDSGSSDLWVMSKFQPSSQTSGRSVLYQPSSNATLLTGQSWNIGYGDGSGASGRVYADTVVIGGVTATSMAVEAATSVSSQFANDQMVSGLVGLAFSSLNTVRPNQQKTFFDTVKPSLVKPVFTANLKKGGPGSYDFGFVNASKYTGAITYSPVQSQSGFWLIKMGGYQIQGKQRVYTSMGNAIADTGTSLLYLPADVVANYWNAVPGAYNSNSIGGYIFPCLANLPKLSLGIRGTLFSMVSPIDTLFDLPGSYLNYAPLSFPITKDTMCFGGLQPNTGIGFSILGDIFLKSVFVIFDQTQASPRIGFAKQA